MNTKEQNFSIENANREQILEGLRNVYSQSGFEVKSLDQPDAFTIVAKDGKASKVEFKWQENTSERLLIDSIDEKNKGHHFVSNAFFDQKTIDIAKQNSITLVDRASLETAINGLPKNLIPKSAPKQDTTIQQASPFADSPSANVEPSKQNANGPFPPISQEPIEPKKTETKQHAASPFATTPNSKENAPSANNPFSTEPDTIPDLKENAKSSFDSNPKTNKVLKTESPKIEEADQNIAKPKKVEKAAEVPAKEETRKEIKKRLKQERKERNAAEKATKVKKGKGSKEKAVKAPKKKLSKKAKIIIGLLLFFIVLPIVATVGIIAIAVLPNIGKIKDGVEQVKAEVNAVQTHGQFPNQPHSNAVPGKNQSLPRVSKAAGKVAKPTPNTKLNDFKSQLGASNKVASQPNAVSKPELSKLTKNGSKPKVTAPGTNLKSPKEVVPTLAKTSVSKPKSSKGSTPKNSPTAIPVATAVTNPTKTTPSAATEAVIEAYDPISPSMFENHIRKSRILGDEKDYWSALPSEAWQTIESEAMKDLDRNITSSNREKIQSYLAVAYLIRNEFEEMTVQLIDLDKTVQVEAVNNLGLTEVDFLSQAGKIVGYNNVIVSK